MLSIHTTGRIFLCFAVCVGGWASAWAQDSASVESWLRRAAVPMEASSKNFGPLDRQFGQARVIALGEATHGQHEVFEAKRQLTKHLIQNHGVRLVAYEASASRMREANEYVSGQSEDLSQAMKGFGMLIWQVEENRGLLQDLRAWNQQASDRDQVHLIGCDAQDIGAAKQRLIDLLGSNHQEMVSEIREIVPRAEASMKELMAGNRDTWDVALDEIDDLRNRLEKLAPDLKANETEYRLRIQEFYFALTMYQSRGGRDQAMAELLLAQLDSSNSDARCVLWAHNAHIQRRPLAYLGSKELAMGGHLAKKLDTRYYALGFAFGEGEFQANFQAPDGTWGFRRYHLSPAPQGSLEATLQTAGLQRFLLDLRSAPDEDAVQQWLETGHGQRWFGGYGVDDRCDEFTRNASTLLQTTPQGDFDGLVYIAKTEAARPIDPQRIINPLAKPRSP